MQFKSFADKEFISAPRHENDRYKTNEEMEYKLEIENEVL